MSNRPGTRTGGRSARVQAAVHEAVHALQAETSRAALTVPLIAGRAGVTPSTIYRRWGDLGSLLADVAAERLRPEHAPADTGGFRDDLLAWAEQFIEEMASGPGLALVRDVLCGAPPADGLSPCWVFSAGQITALVERARARGEDVPDIETVADRVAAPIVYRLLMGLREGIDAGYARRLALGCLADHRPAGAPRH